MTVVDLNAERIAGWNDPDLSQRPVIEPSLAEVLDRGRNLHVSTAVKPAISSADLVFIAVKTPTKSRNPSKLRRFMPAATPDPPAVPPPARGSATPPG